MRQPRPFVEGAELHTEPGMNRPGFQRGYLLDQQGREWQELEMFSQMNLEKMRLADEKKYGKGPNQQPPRAFEPPPMDDLGPDESVSNVGGPMGSPTGHNIWTGLAKQCGLCKEHFTH